jgi:hypothetical protein
MKKSIYFSSVNFNCILQPRKVYFTEDFKELPSAEKQYITAHTKKLKREHKEQLLP